MQITEVDVSILKTDKNIIDMRGDNLSYDDLKDKCPPILKSLIDNIKSKVE